MDRLQRILLRGLKISSDIKGCGGNDLAVFEYTTTRSHLSTYLTATDSSGPSSTAVVGVHPSMVNLEFDSEPSGMTVLLNAEKFTPPISMVGWEGHTLEIESPLQPPPEAGVLSLKRWSEGWRPVPSRPTIPPRGSILFKHMIVNRRFIPGFSIYL